jgi:hypothetical protein
MPSHEAKNILFLIRSINKYKNYLSAIQRLKNNYNGRVIAVLSLVHEVVFVFNKQQHFSTWNFRGEPPAVNKLPL